MNNGGFSLASITLFFILIWLDATIVEGASERQRGRRVSGIFGERARAEGLRGRWSEFWDSLFLFSFIVLERDKRAARSNSNYGAMLKSYYGECGRTYGAQGSSPFQDVGGSKLKKKGRIVRAWRAVRSLAMWCKGCSLDELSFFLFEIETKFVARRGCATSLHFSELPYILVGRKKASSIDKWFTNNLKNYFVNRVRFCEGRGACVVAVTQLRLFTTM